jgi:thiol-disulfide isomerase/thioredoxin
MPAREGKSGGKHTASRVKPLLNGENRMKLRLLFLSVVGLVLLGCSGLLNPSAEQAILDLHNENTRLKSVVNELESDLQKCKAEQNKPENTAQREEQATALYKRMKEDVEAFRLDAAKQKVAEFNQKYSGTRIARGVERLEKELGVIGISAGDLQVSKWLQGSATMNDSRLTLLVFFEEWCPHCRREVPKLQETYTRLKPKGLNIVGLTKVNKSSTEAKVMDLLGKHNVTYPIGKEDGSLSTRFAVKGIPAAALVHDGKVVWRGHPARLNDEYITGFLKISGR